MRKTNTRLTKEDIYKSRISTAADRLKNNLFSYAFTNKMTFPNFIDSVIRSYEGIPGDSRVTAFIDTLGPDYTKYDHIEMLKLLKQKNHEKK